MSVVSVGTASRAYSTIQAAIDDCPANLVTASDTWEMECYNDSEFTYTGTGTKNNITGITTDATHNVQLRCASGQSFADHAGKNDNAQTYNQSNGVGLRKTDNYGTIIGCTVAHTTIRGLQIRHQGSNSSGTCVTLNVATPCSIDQLLILGGERGIYVDGSTTVEHEISNCLVITDHAGVAGFQNQRGNSHLVNVTCVCPTDLTSTAIGFNIQYNGPTAVNCASFGYGTDWDTGWGTSSHNASGDTSAPGTSTQTSLTYANQYEDITDGPTGDFRLKAGNSLAGNGVVDSQAEGIDIVGNTRDGSNPAIGHWEGGVAGGLFVVPAGPGGLAGCGGLAGERGGLAG